MMGISFRQLTALGAAVSVLAAAAVAQPQPAGDDEGPEAIAALYFAPPFSQDPAVLVEVSRLSEAGLLTLARKVGEVEEGLVACQKIRFQMEALIGDTFGSYSIHPDWVRAYQACLRQRHAEVGTLADLIRNRQSALLKGEEAETAVKTADTVAQLSLYRAEVEAAIEKEVDAQKGFVRYYNTGSVAAMDAGPTSPVEVLMAPQAATSADQSSTNDPTPEIVQDAVDAVTEDMQDSASEAE